MSSLSLQELSKITMPIVFNEPLSFLQRITEYMEHIYLVHRASRQPQALERMQVGGPCAGGSQTVAVNGCDPIDWPCHGRDLAPLQWTRQYSAHAFWVLSCQQLRHLCWGVFSTGMHGACALAPLSLFSTTPVCARMCVHVCMCACTRVGVCPHVFLHVCINVPVCVQAVCMYTACVLCAFVCPCVLKGDKHMALATGPAEEQAGTGKRQGSCCL